MLFPADATVVGADRDAWVHAVDGVSLTIRRGETLGLVGESGSGKSTLARLIAALHRPTSGRVRFDGIDVHAVASRELRQMRRRFQMVFQDPFLSLNPRMTVGALVGEGLTVHSIGAARDRPDRVAELLRLVGLRPDHVSRYPHEFSGGQRQRIAIARALAPEPELLVLDEPVSALDVSIQGQVLGLLSDLQQRLGLTYLLIGHDLAVVGNMSRRVAVMYMGQIVEIAERGRLYERPLHPYTRALFAAAPIPDPDVEAARRRIVLQGEVPDPINPPAGCRFASRCPIATVECTESAPALRVIETMDDAHRVACHYAERVGAGEFAVLETW